MRDAYYVDEDDEQASLSMSGLESIEDVLRDTVEGMQLEVVILPACEPRKVEEPVDYPQSEGPSDLAKQISKICRPK